MWENMGGTGQLAQGRRPVAVQGKARRLKIAGQGAQDDKGEAVTELSPDEARELAFGQGAPGDDETTRLARMVESVREEDARHQDESWRTLSARRQLPQQFDRAIDAERAGMGAARAAGDAYATAQQLPGGKFVTGGEEAVRRSLAGSDNAADQLEFLKRTMPQLYNRAVYGPNGPQGGQAPDQQMMASLLGQAQGAAKDVFAGDTQRGDVGVREFEQKLTKPAERASQESIARKGREAQLEAERVRGEFLLEQARMQNQGAMKASQARALEQVAIGQGTPAQKEAAAATVGDIYSRAMEASRPGGGATDRAIRLTSDADGLPVAVTGPDGKPAPKETAAKQLERANESAAFGRQHGLLPPEQGGKAGVFDPDAVATALGRNPALAADPAVIEMLMKGGGGKTPQQIREGLIGAFKRRALDLQSGARGEKIDDGSFFDANYGGMRVIRDRSGKRVRIVTPEGYQIHSSEGLLGPVSRWISRESSPVPILSGGTRSAYQGEVSALGEALRRMSRPPGR